MEHADFWIKKIRDPDRLILGADEIRRMNKRNLNNQDLYLFNVREQKQSLTRDEMLALFKEDWEGFARPEGTRYGRNGKPLTLSFWNDIDQKLNKESIRENHSLAFGLVVKRTDIRVFPTHDACKGVPDEEGFDVFQHSTISPGSLVESTTPQTMASGPMSRLISFAAGYERGTSRSRETRGSTGL